ncbi:MAG: lipid-A-disaccharide synthase [Phycisphaerales bacterium]|nr:lipid-A-disaccharide synthase [Phycisphaerales bacterium]
MTNSDSKPAILFTAFEPSGDDHASIVIAELKLRYPDIRICAWGGRKMEAAGADVIERTGDAAVMGMPGLAKIREHRKINARIARWVQDNEVAVHVPVDSPAANFPVCAIMKSRGVRVVHMVAPQLWAWAPWRIRKLRRLTNHVMCVLPFEEEWFRSRGVEATFIGHPLFEKPIDEAGLDEQIQDWNQGEQQIALMPGSRPSEIQKNFPLLLGAYIKLKGEHPNMCGMVAVTRPEIEPILRQLAKDHGLIWPDSLGLTVANTDAAVRWCTLALVVSGTVTLQIARQHRPMVIVYKIGRIGWSLFARWLIQTPYITLPNILAGREVVTELVPHFVGAEPIADRATELLEDRTKYDLQIQELQSITKMFDSKNAAHEAADIVARYAGLDSRSNRDGKKADSDTPVPSAVGD